MISKIKLTVHVIEITTKTNLHPQVLAPQQGFLHEESYIMCTRECVLEWVYTHFFSLYKIYNYFKTNIYFLNIKNIFILKQTYIYCRHACMHRITLLQIISKKLK